MDRELLVQNIEQYCSKKDVKPTNACRDSGVGTSFLTDIKRGKTPSVAKVQMLAQYLGCTVSDLLGERAGSESDTVSTDELRHLLAYRKAPAPIREIVDTALKPYEA
jgi:transcriptional regulator with XRE-family HTH domain